MLPARHDDDDDDLFFDCTQLVSTLDCRLEERLFGKKLFSF